MADIADTFDIIGHLGGISGIARPGRTYVSRQEYVIEGFVLL